MFLVKYVMFQLIILIKIKNYLEKTLNDTNIYCKNKTFLMLLLNNLNYLDFIYLVFYN